MLPVNLLRSLLFNLFSLASFAGCLLLLVLSRYGQNPFPELPVPTVLFLGALMSGPLFAVSRGYRVSGLALSSLFALTLTGLLGWLLSGHPDFSPVWFLSPLTAVSVTFALRQLRPGRADMLAGMTVYVACTVLATYTLDSFLPLGPFFLINVGTFFFGITFTQRDRVHVYGRRNVYAMIAVAAVMNVIMSLTLDTPIRYVIVSFITIMVAETADTEIYHRLLHKPWLTRVARSNAVSAPLDTILFTVLAFWGEAWATFDWMLQVIVTDVLVKYGASMLVALGFLNYFTKRYPAVMRTAEAAQAYPQARE